LAILRTNRNLKKDLAKVKKLSNLVEEKITKSNQKDLENVGKLSSEELDDLSQILNITNFILCKHEDNKELHSMLKELVRMINDSVNSIEILNDQISEQVISAECSIKRIKDLQSDVSDNFAFESIMKRRVHVDSVDSQHGANNLTKSSIPVYTHEYQQKSAVETEQVI